MSNYKVPYRYDVHWGYINESIELNPRDYLDCNDECDLNDSVYDDIWDSFSVGDLEIDQAEMDFSLPKEFIDEWRRLKGYEV